MLAQDLLRLLFVLIVVVVGPVTVNITRMFRGADDGMWRHQLLTQLLRMAEMLCQRRRQTISLTVIFFFILTVAYCLFRILRAPAAGPWLRHTETTSAADAGVQDWREFRVTSLSPPNEPSYSGNYSTVAEIVSLILYDFRQLDLFVCCHYIKLN